MRLEQFGQLEGGETTESPRGTLYMQTLRKLPIMAPKTKGRINMKSSDIK